MSTGGLNRTPSNGKRSDQAGKNTANQQPPASSTGGGLSRPSRSQGSYIAPFGALTGGTSGSSSSEPAPFGPLVDDAPTTAPASTTNNAPGQPLQLGVTESESSTGQATYRLGNGQQVPRNGPDGEAGTVGADGSVTYGDGSRYETDAKTGNTVLTRPDGSSSAYNNKGQEIQHGVTSTESSDGQETYRLGNGQQVPRNGPDGEAGMVGADGSVTYGDGTSYEVDGKTGNTVLTRPDGSSSTYNAQGQEIQNGVTSTQSSDGQETYRLGNGQQVPRNGPDGSAGTVGADGSVTYNDGTTYEVDGKTGNTVLTRPDGSTSTYNPKGQQVQHGVTSTESSTGEATYRLGNGQQVPRSGPNGEVGKVMPDGSVHYGDGTIMEVDSKTGNTVVTRPDGSSSSHKPTTHTSSSSDSSNSNDDDNNDDDNNDDDNNSDDGGDSGEGEDDSGDEGEGEGEDSGDDGSSDENNWNAGLSGSGSQPEAKTTADDFVARKKGEKNDPESVAPPECGDGGSGPNMNGAGEPQPGDTGNCVPAGIGPSTEEDEEEEEAPEDEIFATPSIDDFRDNDGTGPDSVINPTGMDEDYGNRVPSFDEQLEDIGDAVNPGR